MDMKIHNYFQDVGAWQKLLIGLLEFMCTDTGEILSDEFQEDVQDMLEYSNEFSQLSNARLHPPPVSPEVCLGYFCHQWKGQSHHHDRVHRA